MKARSCLGTALMLTASSLFAANENPPDETVILDETGVRNLRIETIAAEPTTFEETVFALGRIEARPENVVTISSHIPGRVVEIAAATGQRVQAGLDVLRVESRQPGNPPPSISLRAPLAGLVTKLDVHRGDPVEPDRALMEIADLSQVFAVARVPEAAAGRLSRDAVAQIVVPAAPQARLTGKFVRFGTMADRDTGTIDVFFAVENAGDRLRPGMRAEFSIVIGRRENVVAVPRSAVQGEPSNRFVYVKHFDLPNAFVKTPVVVGQANDREVEIVSGLFPADEVVTRGAYSLAFAGGGSMSLKEALDAAHGHEHNADGSEITSEQNKPKGDAASDIGGDGHAHADGHGDSLFWKIATGVLFVALVAVSVRRKK